MPVSRNRRIPAVDKDNRTKARRVLRRKADELTRRARLNALREYLRKSVYADKGEW